MSYKLLNLQHGYFTAPQALLEDDRYAKLTPAECKLLLFLYAAMNRLSAPCIRVSSAQLKKYLGMETKTIRTARRGLESKRYIRCDRAEKAGAPYELHLLNPETGEPFPPEEGRSAIVEYRPRKAKAAENPQKDAECRAGGGSRTISAPAAGGLYVKPPEWPSKGIFDVFENASSRHKSELVPKRPNKDEVKRTCPLHPDARHYFDGKGEWHCGNCEPSPYLPPQDSFRQPAKAARQFTQPTADEIFGRG